MRLTQRILLIVFLIVLFLASLIATSKVQAQAREDPSPISDQIFAARSAYTNSADAGNNAGAAEETVDVAQLMRNRPPQPRSARPGYSRTSYRNPWIDQRDPRHALIGGLIGFGLGAAIGAKANTSPYPGSTARAVLLIGGVGALIGAAVGTAHDTSYAFVPHHRAIPPSPGHDEYPDLNASSAVPDSAGGVAQARAGQ